MRSRCARVSAFCAHHQMVGSQGACEELYELYECSKCGELCTLKEGKPCEHVCGEAEGVSASEKDKRIWGQRDSHYNMCSFSSSSSIYPAACHAV